jgi:hypothetical protein
VKPYDFFVETLWQADVPFRRSDLQIIEKYAAKTLAPWRTIKSASRPGFVEFQTMQGKKVVASW